MNILILGSGGREHTFAWKLHQSNKVKKLLIAPGNAGTGMIGENISLALDDFDAIGKLALEQEIDIILVGPEVPLVEGIHDYFLQQDNLKHIAVIGPRRAAAALEGSKEFAKEFMQRHGIPTAAYKSFGSDDISAGYEFLESLSPPYVLKADGLAAGKGVLIINDLQEAKNALKEMLVDAKFGKASAKVVIEEFLSGTELSCFVLTDGTSYKILPTAKDYKRIGEGDTGLNTGGMGAISPVPFAGEDFMSKVRERIIVPTINGLTSDDLPYKGFIFIGLIEVKGEPFVIEYNVRMGDPETEAVIPRITSDFAEVLQAVAENRLNDVAFEIDPRAAVTIMMVSGGYPEDYTKGYKIEGLSKIEHAIVFHAGTLGDAENDIRTNGGRVLSVTAFGEDYKKALYNAYSEVAKISFKDAYYRKDLGFDL